MKEYQWNGFSTSANMALNNAISMAQTYNAEEVKSSYVMLMILRHGEVAAEFYSDTEIVPTAYKNAVINELETWKKNRAERECAGEKFKNTEDPNAFTQELSAMVSSLVLWAKRTGNSVSSADIYNEIISNKDSAAWDVLSALGANYNDVMKKRNTDLPLARMKTTAKYAVDYNVLALEGRFDPIEAREDVIDKTFEVLGRRIKNNPCLVGDAGVGKTAIVEGMAQRIVNGVNVPFYLRKKHIISVDISSVVAGSRYRGDFEERLNSILNEAASEKEVILFFDEFHMLAEAGGANNDSSMTAANMLKPAISRGDVQIIGATTTPEYKKFIEEDKAFERRLQKVQVPEPSVKEAIQMVNAVIGQYDKFHNSTTSAEAIKAAVSLSDRYITDKKLPDKAITVIDETAARLKKWVETDEEGKPKTTVLVTVPDIKETISRLTGIEIDELDSESRDKVRNLETSLRKHVIGQDEAVKNVTKAIKRSKAGVKDPNRPIGSFLFVGPTGVGKTELAKALSIEFSGGNKSLVRFDMSEFMEKHSVAKLIGSPPGYVGYGEGGQLTEAIRRNPYSIVLFDEIEKAHPDVFNILLQILDDGILTDSEGTRVDFKNTIIIMTSNAGYSKESIDHKSSIGFGLTSDTKSVGDENRREKEAIKALENTFRPEFLNRLDKIVVFNKLSKEDNKNIIELVLNKLNNRVNDSNNITLTWTDSVVDHILDIGFSDKYGARNLKRKVQEVIEDELSDRIIDEVIKPFDKVIIDYDKCKATDNPVDGMTFVVEHEVYSINMSKEELLVTE